MDSKSKTLYGLIGCPLTHSFSKSFFNKKFEAESINAEYVNFEIPDIDFLMEIFSENPELQGLNVTIPYKEQIIPYLDEIDSIAAEIGAVNVIKVIKTENDFKLKGYNSDIVGFTRSIRPLLTNDDKNALVLGTGGAAKAVTAGLKSLGINVTPVSRSKKSNVLTYSELDKDIMRDNTVIVNTTPLGMYPHTDNCPDIPYEYLTKDHLCYDLIYNPEKTLFLQKAETQGCRIKNGNEMLLLQALESWSIWNK